MQSLRAILALFALLAVPEVGAETKSCLCNVGQFWHYHLGQCVNHLKLGEKCSNFPHVDKPDVCADGLKCKLQKGHKSLSLCEACNKDDQCKAGEARRQQTCQSQLRDLEKPGLQEQAHATVNAAASAQKSARDAAVAGSKQVQAAKKLQETVNAAAGRPASKSTWKALKDMIDAGHEGSGKAALKPISEIPAPTHFAAAAPKAVAKPAASSGDEFSKALEATKYLLRSTRGHR